MIIRPIIPIYIMVPICIIVCFFRRKDIYSFIRQIIIIVLLFLINIRIMIPSENVQVMSSNLDVLFVVDTTISMNAEDYNGKNTRLSGAIEDCIYIIEKLNGSNFSIISFDNNSKILIPYTKNTTFVTNTLKGLKPLEELYARGSSLNIPLENIYSILELSVKKEDRKRAIFFISDGEMTSEEPLESFEKIKEYIDGGAVLGYGTNDGGYMKTKNKYSNEETYINDKTTYPYSKAISKLDEDNLKKIAKDIGIDYIHMEKQSKIDYKLDEIKNVLLKSNQLDEKSDYVDIYYIFAIPLLILLIYEFIDYKRKLE